MGLAFRKSISAGPLRFNLSRSGIGMSSGVKGLRGRNRTTRGLRARRRRRWAPLPADPRIEARPTRPAGVTAAWFGVAAAGERTGRRDAADEQPRRRRRRGPRSGHAERHRPPHPGSGRSCPNRGCCPRRSRTSARKLTWEADRAVPLFYELDDDLFRSYEAVIHAGAALAQSPGRYYDVNEERTDAHRQLQGHGGAGTLARSTPADHSDRCGAGRRVVELRAGGARRRRAGRCSCCPTKCSSSRAATTA